jgi:hypothetical protein
MSFDPTKSKCQECGETGHPWWDHPETTFRGEDPLEPYWDEMIATDPVYITTRGQRRKIMSQKNFEYRKKFEKPPGQTLYFT